jgi:hypothetical protein
MRFLFHEIVFCECGRPALPGSTDCRTCYEDALRRKWRDEFRFDEGRGSPGPVAPVAVRAINPRARPSYAPGTGDGGQTL